MIKNKKTEIIEPKRIQGPALLLYSGGLDTTYIAAHMEELGIEIILLNLDFNVQRHELSDMLNGQQIIYENVVDEFLKDYLSPSIKNGFFIDDEYPISASLSFPLIAKKGVEYGQRLGISTIIHGAEISQNAMSRFNKVISGLDKNIYICPYAMYDSTTREEKKEYLNLSDVKYKQFDYSRDKNVWCECIESGNYDNDAYNLNYEDFLVNPKINDCHENICTLIFKDGMPIAINGESKSLKDIICFINVIAAPYRIGFYSSYEFNGLEKLRELHYSPSAAIIHRSKRALERVCLSEHELETKYFLDRKWVSAVIRGEWGSTLCCSIDDFNKSISKKINGKVTLELNVGGVNVLSTEFFEQKVRYSKDEYRSQRLIEIKG